MRLILNLDHPQYNELKLKYWLSRTKPLGDCLIWQGATDAAGYGRAQYRKISGYIHRWIWVVTKGPIPQDLEVDHTCHTRSCINIEHLRIITHSENMLNMKRPVGQACKKGHLKSTMPNGDRVCVPCRDTSVAKWKEENADRWFDIRLKNAPISAQRRRLKREQAKLAKKENNAL